jgi:hypothetical protein
MKTTRFKYILLFMMPMMFLPLVQPGAVDFGLVVNNYFGAYNQIGNKVNEYEYRFDVLPRVLIYIGDIGEFYMSARVGLGREEIGQGKKDYLFIVSPEATRTDITLRFGNWGLNFGRLFHADPLGFINTGLFDGIKLSHTSKDGNISVGALYTGFLFKKSANIALTAEEQIHYDMPVENPYDTYFAPGHMLLSLDYEHPSVFEKFQLKAAVTEQIDISRMDDKYHSQYFTLKTSLPYKSFTFDFGASFEMALSVLEGDDNYSNAFAFDGGVYWMLPTKFSSRLALTGRYGGQVSQGIFVPLTNRFYGNVLKARLPGLSVFTLDYSARIISSLRTSLSVMYFVRNDLWTYAGYPVDINNNAGHLLGPEFFTRIVWTPFSDINVNLGGGMFLPSLGNVNPGQKFRWYAELSVALTLF